MSNWSSCYLDVLASSPVEINQIAERLKQPSTELVKRIAESWGEPAFEIAAELKELFGFEIIADLGYVDKSRNKSRRFGHSFQDRCDWIISDHLLEISAEFPSTIFLLSWCSESGRSGRAVMRAGEVVQKISEGSRTQFTRDWTALDIFSPFTTEYDEGLEFGSLWNQWVDDVIAAAQGLKHSPATDAEDAFAVSGTSPTDDSAPGTPANPEPDTPTFEYWTPLPSTTPAPTNNSSSRSDATTQNSEVSNG